MPVSICATRAALGAHRAPCAAHSTSWPVRRRRIGSPSRSGWHSSRPGWPASKRRCPRASGRACLRARRQVLESARQAEVYAAAGAPPRPSLPDCLTLRDDRHQVCRRLRTRASNGGSRECERAYAATPATSGRRYFDGAAERDGVGASATSSILAVYNGMTSTSTRRTSGAGMSCTASSGRCARRAKDPARRAPSRRPRRARDRPGRAIDGVESSAQWMQDLQDRTIAEMDGVHFDIPAPVKRVEAMIAPPGGALAMYYTGPSEDFSRPGRTWYPTRRQDTLPALGRGLDRVPRGRARPPPAVAPARVPGERALAVPAPDGRHISGYVEGWALYAERLMGELGYLDNPEYYLGMLRAQAMRAVRVIIDIGMHLELPIPGASASTRASGGTRSSAMSSRTSARAVPARLHEERDRPLPRLARTGHQLQGRRALLARGARGIEASAMARTST